MGTGGSTHLRIGAQSFELPLAQANRFGALARHVGMEAKRSLKLADGDRSDGEEDEGQQRLEKCGAACLPRHVNERGRLHQKSFQLPSTRTKVPVPPWSSASTCGSWMKSAAALPE